MEEQQQQEVQQKFERVIDLGDGSGVQRFEADSMEALVDKLAKAQEHATRKIREQARQIKTGLGLISPDTDSPLPEWKPKHRTADEEWQRAQQLQDPAKYRGAVASVVEDELGFTIGELRAMRRELEIKKRVDAQQIAAQEWTQEHPDYFVSAENGQALVAYLEKHKMAMTKNNLTIAYDDLRDSGLLKAKPAEAEPKKEASQAEPTPEGIPQAAKRSSSLRPGQSSSAGAPPRTNQVTWAEINKMKPDDYAARLRSDPAFRKAVDSLPPQY